MIRAVTANKPAKFSLLQLALPSKAVQNIGILLLDPSTDRLYKKLRSDWNTFVDSEHLDVLESLDGDFDGKITEMGGDKFLLNLEDTVSNTFRITDREDLAVSDFEAALNRLYEAHVQRTEVIPFVTHVPLYSLTGGAIATTVEKLVRWAHWRSIAVSIDLSSISVIESLGVGEVRRLLGELSPDVMFANADEARVMNIESAIGNAITIVKAGSGPARVLRQWGSPVEIPAETIASVSDTTGAGDAFAAGVLTYRGWGDDPEAGDPAGHRDVREGGPR